jgi:hypothetical protein
VAEAGCARVAFPNVKVKGGRWRGTVAVVGWHARWSLVALKGLCAAHLSLVAGLDKATRVCLEREMFYSTGRPKTADLRGSSATVQY